MYRNRLATAKSRKILFISISGSCLGQVEEINLCVFSCVVWKPKLSDTIFSIYYTDVFLRVPVLRLPEKVKWPPNNIAFGTQLKVMPMSTGWDHFFNCVSLLCSMNRTDRVS